MQSGFVTRYTRSRKTTAKKSGYEKSEKKERREKVDEGLKACSGCEYEATVGH